MNLEEKILNKIKEEKITPKPFWYFLIKDYSLWLLVFLSIILATLSIAPIIFILENFELGYAKHISPNIFSFVLFNLPFFWILLCAVTIYFATLAWENTKHGYKFKGEYIFIISFLISLILGILLHTFQYGRLIDNRMRDASFGSYKSFEDRRQNFWFNPEEGRILGTVDKISTSSFELVTEEKNFTKEIVFDENLPGKKHIFDGSNIRVIGFADENESQKFIACAIFPDNLPPEKRIAKNAFDKKINEKMEELSGRPGFHEECKKIFEKGRANFRK